MPKRTVSDRLQSLEPGSEAAGRKRAASKATATPLSPASQRAFAVLTEAGLQDKFISPDESNERNPKRSKAEKRDCKRKRKLNNEYWCGKAEPPEQPPPPQPERVEARHKRPEQDKVHAVPKHTTRSTHSAFKQASDDYIGRRVAWTSEKGRWAGEATVVEANEWGEHLLRRRDGEEVWVDLAECLQSKELKFVYVGCGCPGIVDGLCERDLKARRVYPSTAKVKVTTFDGLDSVMVTGNRMLPSGLLEEVRTTADNMLNVTIAKHGGNKGGKDALVKRYTDHGSPLCARCGTCYGNGTAEREVDGETVCVPASRVSSYGAQYSEQAWSDVRHIPPAVADVTRRAYNVLLPNLSEATKECGAFNSIQIRVYDGTQKTGEHTDTRVACDKRTGEPKSTKLPNQVCAPHQLPTRLLR